MSTMNATFSDPEDDTKQDEKIADNDHTPIAIEIDYDGYLEIHPVYLYTKPKKRYIILKENHLFSYDNEKKTRITESIDLSSYNKAQLSSNELTQFQLVTSNTFGTNRCFSAKTMDEAQKWIKHINSSMRTSAKVKQDDVKTKENDELLNQSLVFFC